jgi:hypothetical protein
MYYNILINLFINYYKINFNGGTLIKIIQSVTPESLAYIARQVMPKSFNYSILSKNSDFGLTFENNLNFQAQILSKLSLSCSSEAAKFRISRL